MRYNYGIYQGFVTSIDDPEKRGRIKCTCPDILDTSESGWCEPCFPNACDDGGDFYLPKIGEGVWVMFIDGKANRPVYLGGWWSKNSTPLKTQYINNKRFINYGDATIEMGEEVSIILDGVTSLKVSDMDVHISTTPTDLSPNSVLLNLIHTLGWEEDVIDD